MKKLAIVTLVDNKNYGNRLQNFALSYYLNQLGAKTKTIWVKSNFKKNIKRLIKRILGFIVKKYKLENMREKKFENFSKKIDNLYISKSSLYNISEIFDGLIFGSDQIWNPDVVRENDMSLKNFGDDILKYSYAASIGVADVDYEFKDTMKKELKSFDFVSVREESAKDILKLFYDGNISVNVDPVMLLSSEEWGSIATKPKELSGRRYILNYFLGNLSKEKEEEIKKFAKRYDCDIINLLDKNDKFYTCGPEEFLYLEQNAFLICTDSFHSSVFAFLFNRPFVIFERDEVGMNNMGTRLHNLVSKFKLKNRIFTGIISEENLECDYSESINILELEREKSKQYLEKIIK